MTNNVIEAAKDNGSSATPGGDEQMFVLWPATRHARDVLTRAQEDAAMDAEDILTQAEEANALDPVG